MALAGALSLIIAKNTTIQQKASSKMQADFNKLELKARARIILGNGDACRDTLTSAGATIPPDPNVGNPNAPGSDSATPINTIFQNPGPADPYLSVGDQYGIGSPGAMQVIAMQLINFKQLNATPGEESGRVMFRIHLRRLTDLNAAQSKNSLAVLDQFVLIPIGIRRNTATSAITDCYSVESELGTICNQLFNGTLDPNNANGDTSCTNVTITDDNNNANPAITTEGKIRIGSGNAGATPQRDAELQIIDSDTPADNITLNATNSNFRIQDDTGRFIQMNAANTRMDLQTGVNGIVLDAVTGDIQTRNGPNFIHLDASQRRIYTNMNNLHLGRASANDNIILRNGSRLCFGGNCITSADNRVMFDSCRALTAGNNTVTAGQVSSAATQCNSSAGEVLQNVVVRQTPGSQPSFTPPATLNPGSPSRVYIEYICCIMKIGPGGQL